MATTIQVSEGLRNKLETFKMFDSESYEDILWDLIEDHMELSKETKLEILEAEKDIKAGRVKTLEQVKRELGL